MTHIERPHIRFALRGWRLWLLLVGGAAVAGAVVLIFRHPLVNLAFVALSVFLLAIGIRRNIRYEKERARRSYGGSGR